MTNSGFRLTRIRVFYFWNIFFFINYLSKLKQICNFMTILLIFGLTRIDSTRVDPTWIDPKPTNPSSIRTRDTSVEQVSNKYIQSMRGILTSQPLWKDRRAETREYYIYMWDRASDHPGRVPTRCEWIRSFEVRN